MSPIETFFTFAFGSTFAVALLATWLRFVSQSSRGKRA